MIEFKENKILFGWNRQKIIMGTQFMYLIQICTDLVVKNAS